MKQIPWLLALFRLSLAPIFPLGYFAGAGSWIYVTALVAGIFSDVFDGILARRWNCSTPALRRLDGNIDTIFYSSAGVVAVFLHAKTLLSWRMGLAIMFAFMVTQNLVSIFRYGRQPSYHMYSGKLWSIALVTALIGLFLSHSSRLALGIMIGLSIYNSLEDIVASLVLPKPMTDIPTVFHAVRLSRMMQSVDLNSEATSSSFEEENSN
jgi:CDP-diacylglycerol--glycerol-3-phosphate 3-phosphatidyltransferase